MAEEKSYVADEFTIDDSLIEEAERDKAERSGATVAVEEADTVEVVEAVTDGEATDTVADDEAMPEAKPKAKRGRKKKADVEVEVVEAVTDGEATDTVADDEAMPDAKPKAKRGRKKKADVEAEVVEAVTDGEATDTVADDEAMPEAKPKAKRGRKKKADTEAEVVEAVTDGEAIEAVADGEAMPEAKPKAKRGRKKKADVEVEVVEAVTDGVATDTVADGEAMPEAKPKAKRGRKKKADTEAEAVEAVADGEATEAVADGEAANATVIEDGVELEIVDIMPEIFPLGEGGNDSGATDTSLFDTDEKPVIEGGEDIEESAIEGEVEDLPHKDEAITAPVPERRAVVRKEAKYDPEKPRRVDFIFDFLELFVFTLAAVLIITTFLVRHSIVEGPSMEGTLQSGDTLLLSNVFYTPKAGDIVVVDDHTSSLPYPIVKRVIAVGGQWVRIARDGVYVDGEKLDEPYVYTDGMNYVYTHHLPGEALVKNPTFRIYRSGINNDVIEYYELEVPEGDIFIMGDHRNASTDSRIIGTVRVDAVLGKVLFRILPFSSFGAVE